FRGGARPATKAAPGVKESKGGKETAKP
ncbi:MAG: hypothetical protein RLZZ447_1440, partial [Verrucomicrobiota bacterium]